MGGDGTVLPYLSGEWRETAASVARNLSLPTDLAQIPIEHWQRVLGAVEQRMRMRGATPPDRWRDALSRQVGRSDPAAGSGLER